MVDCAAKGGARTRCGPGPATRRCGLCGAVSYCSSSHQREHWKYHKDECKRLEEQMSRAHALNALPFSFSPEISQLGNGETINSRNCAILQLKGIHQKGMWKYECNCGPTIGSVENFSENWYLPSLLCPCSGTNLHNGLNSWQEYYEWRGLSLNSPVALLLHWPLTIYHCIRSFIPEARNELHIHYLGPERENYQFPVFGELRALFPGFKIRIDFVGPAIPNARDGEMRTIYNYAHCFDDNCSCKSSHETNPSLILKFHKGLYHERYNDIIKESKPDIIIAPNAGIAAYSTWIPTLELIKEKGISVIFTDYCEEAAYLASSCISSVTGHKLTVPIQVNPFRQPLSVENNALNLPCYSNCFLFGF